MMFNNKKQSEKKHKEEKMNIQIPKVEWLENPEVFRVNRIDAHSDHLYFETLQEAEKLDEIKLKQSLNGMWKFAYAKNPDVREKEFYKEEFDCSKFSEIEVPAMKHCFFYILPLQLYSVHLLKILSLQIQKV